MNRDIVLVFVSALVATVNPSLLAATTVMMLLPQRKRLMTGYLLGAYTTSVAAGLAIVLSLHGSSVVKTSTHLLSPSGEIVIGAIALLVALVMATGHDNRVRGWREHRKKAHTEILRLKVWFARHGRQVAMVGLIAIGALLAMRGALTVS